MRLRDQRRLQELIAARGDIEIKYHLVEADADGFDTIRDKVAAEVARAQARGQTDAEVTVYQNAIAAAGQGMAAVNEQIDAQYDKEYALIQLMEDSAERQAAMDDLNAWKKEFNDSFRDCGGLGVRAKPMYDFDKLYATYPRAAAYLKAEEYADSSHYAKSAAGKKARRSPHGERGLKCSRRKKTWSS